MCDDSAHAADGGASVLCSSFGIKESQVRDFKHTRLKKIGIFAMCTVYKLGLIKPVWVNTANVI